MSRLHFPCFLVALVLSVSAAGSDWPAYMADAARSGVSGDELKLPLSPVWSYQTASKVAPAWPEPGKEAHRLDFDYAFQPIVASGTIYFGSSADDAVWALELESGKLKWRYTTGGPVRFAPAYAEGKIYAVSDDGYLYCLDAQTGKLLWQVRGGPDNRKLLGNGRLVSRWPCRSGVLVDGGVVYFTAGMWPSEGVYIYALDAQSGKEIWRNDNSGTLYIAQPHGGSSAFTGVTPQGYMLATADKLIVPSGRTTPAAYERRTGKLLWYQPYLYLPGYPSESWSCRSNGGSFIALAGDVFFNAFHMPSAPDLPGKTGEAGPQPGDGLASFSLKTGLREHQLPDRHRLLAVGDVAYAAGEDEIVALELKKWKGTAKDAGPCLWSAKVPGRVYALAVAGDLLLVGGTDAVTVLGLKDGTVRDSIALSAGKPTGEQVRGLAIASGRVVVATNQGLVICLAPGTVKLTTPKESVQWPSGTSKDAQEILRRTGVTRGYALIVGAANRDLALGFVSGSELHVIQETAGAEDWAQLRGGNILRLWGPSRYAIERLNFGGKLGYPSYFANLVVVAGDTAKLPAKELYRVLRPCGGKLCFVDLAAEEIQRFIAAAGIPPEEVQGTGADVVVTRGKLPGAGEWRCQWADLGRTGINTESRLRLPLEILWFGGPGPDRMMPRHWATSPPLSVNGRTFVTGSDDVICFDAYNGLEWWAHPLKDVGRKSATHTSANFAADDDCVYATAGNACHRLSQETGEERGVYAAPPLPQGAKRPRANPPIWGYLGVGRDVILGSHNLDDFGAYSAAIFALNKTDGALRWTYVPKDDVVVTRSISASDQALFLIEAAVEKGKPRGKAPCQLVALDLARGTEKWRRACETSGGGVVCAQGVVFLGGCGAFDAGSGRPLWSQADSGVAALVRGDKLLALGEWKETSRAYDLRTGKPWVLPDPVTGAPQPWEFFRAYGCGDVIGCQNLLFFRSGTAGIFDMDAQALTNFGGMRPNCSVSMIPANGLVVIPEASSACSCSYNFQTSLALLPGDDDRELWTVFGGEPEAGRVKQLRLNFGAPGDRREAGGRVWLAFPRPVLPAAKPVFVDVGLKDTQWYHRRTLAATLPPEARPWLYTTGVSGAGALTVHLAPRGEVCAPRVAVPPVVDGKLDDPAWRGLEPLPFWENAHLTEPKSALYLCQDAQALYVGFRREAARKNGKPVPFAGASRDEEAAIRLRDDALEVFLTGRKGGVAVRLGLTAGNALFDGLRQASNARVDYAWNGKWEYKALVSEQEFVAELKLPFASLREAGLDVEHLRVNALSRNVSNAGPRDTQLTHAGRAGWPLCTGFLRVTDKPGAVAPRPYTVRLHWAEPDGLAPGARVFNVRVQGEQRLAAFDPAKESGGAGRPVVKEFKGVPIAGDLTVELQPVTPGAPPPVLCGLEVLAEE